MMHTPKYSRVLLGWDVEQPCTDGMPECGLTREDLQRDLYSAPLRMLGCRFHVRQPKGPRRPPAEKAARKVSHTASEPQASGEHTGHRRCGRGRVKQRLHGTSAAAADQAAAAAATTAAAIMHIPISTGILCKVVVQLP